MEQRADRRARRVLAAAAVALTAMAAAVTAVTPAAMGATPTFGSGVTVSHNAGGHLEAFASDFDGDIVHAWQRADNSWSAWTQMPFASSFALARPGVGLNADGHLEIFAQSGTRMYSNWQLTTGGWSGWHDFGGSFRATSFTQPVTANNADGRLEVFAIDGDGRLAHRYKLGLHLGWSSWQSLGGSFDRSTIPAVARNPDGRLEVFVLGDDGALRHAWQTAPNGGWSGWASLGGNVMHGKLWGPSVVPNAGGRLEIFVAGTDHQLYHKWQLATGGWSEWHQLYGFIDRPVAVRNSAGRIEVFARASSGPQQGYMATPVKHLYQRDGGGWSGWSDLSGGGPLTYQAPSATKNADGRLEVFAQHYSGSRIVHTWQTAPLSGWSNWWTLAG